LETGRFTSEMGVFINMLWVAERTCALRQEGLFVLEMGMFTLETGGSLGSGAYPCQARAAPMIPVVSPYLRTKGDDGVGAYLATIHILIFSSGAVLLHFFLNG